uniref:C2H2-type domain-containing protein n=1 Tax=Ditylenchus dipsaci TaxID=166011 RepID=A0A915EDF5_9BILA
MKAIEEIRPSEQQILNVLPSTSAISSLNCDVCNKTFQNRSAKRFHMTKTHALTNSPSWTAKLLLQHFQKIHLEKVLKCGVCEARFSLMRDLNYHVKKRCSARQPGEIVCASKKFSSVFTNKGSVNRKSVETQTDKHNEAMKRFLLIPITKYRSILPKPLPKFNTTSSTQVNIQECAAGEWILPNSAYIQTENSYEDNQTSNFVDIGLQADLSCFDEFNGQTDDPLNNYCYPASTNNSQQQQNQLQDSFSQTVYPQTVDFGTQYASTGCNRVALELPPLKSTRSTANALVGTDACGTAAYSANFLSSMTSNSNSMSQYLESSASNSNYWRHIETQTSSGHWEQEQNNPYCTNLDYGQTLIEHTNNMPLDYNCVQTQTMCQWSKSTISENAQSQLSAQNLNICQYEKPRTIDFSCMTERKHV